MKSKTKTNNKSLKYKNPFYIPKNKSNITIEPKTSSKIYKNIISRKRVINFNLNPFTQEKKNFNFLTQKTKKIKRRIKIFESEINLSRNNYNKFKKLNSFLFNDNDINILNKKNINYCFDEKGNPMNIKDIINKNKRPIAFIMNKGGKNFLLNLNFEIIKPNNQGNYNLKEYPYIIIDKYDVIYPELRVLDNNKFNNDFDLYDNSNNNYNQINNYNTLGDIDNNRNNFKNDLYSTIKNENKISISLKNNKNKFHLFSPIIKSHLNIYQTISNNNTIKNKKRKYIFVNKLKDNNKTTNLNKNINKTNIIQNENNKKDNNYKEMTKTIDTNLYIKPSKILNKTNINKNDINSILTSLKNNLEFKFERKFKSIKNSPNINKEEINFTPNKRNKNKKNRYSYSLNEYALNPLITNTLNNIKNLDSYNNILTNAKTETCDSTMQQNKHNYSYINRTKSNISKNKLNNKCYLKPKINSVRIYYRRTNTENFTNNYITPFSLNQDDTKDNNICKCPFCHNLFYS